jgi:hypothetical protein
MGKSLRSSVVLMALMLSALEFTGCTRSEAPPKRATGPPSLHTGFIGLVPVADGGAYATGWMGGVWYLREGVSSRVKGLPNDQFVLSRIVAIADGGAYLVVDDDGPAQGVWYLRGDSARRVEEVGSLRSDGKPTDRAAWLWVQRQEEARARESAEEEASERRDREER